jgi:hypothetical protein
MEAAGSGTATYVGMVPNPCTLHTITLVLSPGESSWALNLFGLTSWENKNPCKQQTCLKSRRFNETIIIGY